MGEVFKLGIFDLAPRLVCEVCLDVGLTVPVPGYTYTVGRHEGKLVFEVDNAGGYGVRRCGRVL